MGRESRAGNRAGRGNRAERYTGNRVRVGGATVWAGGRAERSCSVGRC